MRKYNKNTFVYFAINKQPYFSITPFKILLKIGHSSDPKKRSYSLQDQPNSINIVHTIECNSKKLACHIERGFHRIFSEDKAFCDSNEWFNINESTKTKLKIIGVQYENFI